MEVTTKVVTLLLILASHSCAAQQTDWPPAYCTELNEAALKQALGDAEKGKAPAIRDLIMSKLMNMDTWPQPRYEEILAGNRLFQMGRK